MKKAARIAGVLFAVGLVVCAGLSVYMRGHGFTARAQPGRLETVVARSARSLAIPDAARQRPNPVPLTEAAVRDGLAHFADHCAVCHANDGSGATEMGRGLYPKPPDMRLAATQAVTDGELFYLIENGVPLTGMPAWGTGEADGEAASWRLVHFIRHLPKLTEEELAHMTELNPKSVGEWRQRMEEEEFLKGGEVPAAPRPAHKHSGGDR